MNESFDITNSTTRTVGQPTLNRKNNVTSYAAVPSVSIYRQLERE